MKPAVLVVLAACILAGGCMSYERRVVEQPQPVPAPVYAAPQPETTTTTSVSLN